MPESEEARGRTVLQITSDREKLQNYDKIEKSVKELDGVTKAEINPVMNVIKVEYDPKKLTLEQIRRMLHS